MTFPLWIKYWRPASRTATAIRDAVMVELTKKGIASTLVQVTFGDVPGHRHLVPPTCCATVEVRNPTQAVPLDHRSIADALGDRR